MDRLRLSIASLSMVAVGLVGCGPSEREAPKAPTPAPTAAAPAPAAPAPQAAGSPAADVDAELARLAAEVYIYAYPLVLTDVTRQTRSAAVGSNAFVHRRGLPDASAPGPDPNADFLYSEAWLDLSKGPIVLSVPDTKNRYYLIAMLDAWTNVASSLGTRTTGDEKGEFAIVGPRFKGTLPGGVSEVRSPTDMAWLLARTEVRGTSDLGAANKVQEQYRLVPLAQRGKRPAKAEPVPKESDASTHADPRERVARMDAATFFSHFAALLPANPPARDDAPMVAKIEKLGIVGGQRFDTAKRDERATRSIEQGAKTALDAVVKATKGIGSADIRNGWTIDRDVGRWGTDYGKRAVAAWKGLGVNAPEDAIFMATRLDGGGHRLDGVGRYVLHFDAGKAPPAGGFWSVSLYDEQRRFVGNPLGRFNRGSNDRLVANADGSIDILLQASDPGADKAANWLPAPKGPFNLILRIYWPKEEVLDGRWLPPGVRRIS